MRYVSFWFVFLFCGMINLASGELSPYINSVSPMQQKPGQAIRIQGQNLSLISGIRFDSYESNRINFISDKEIEVVLPLPGGNNSNGPWKISNITVSSPMGESFFNSGEFTILKPNPPPRIESIVPNLGSRVGGNTVTLYGSNFSPSSTVRFGEFSCGQLNYVNPKTLQCSAPSQGPGPVDVVIENSDLQSFKVPQGYFYSWTRRYGLENTFSEGEQIVSDPNGNIYIASTDSPALTGALDFENRRSYLLKLNKAGEKLWKIPVLVDNLSLYVTSIATSHDGTILIGGQSSISQSIRSGFVAKYNSDGSLIWLKYLSENTAKEFEKNYPHIKKVVSDEFNNVYLVGSTNVDLNNQQSIVGWKAFIVKLDSNGEKVWTFHEGTPNADEYQVSLAKSAIIDSHGNLIIAGSSNTSLEATINGVGGPLFVSKYYIRDSDGPKRTWVKKINELDSSLNFSLHTTALSLVNGDDIVILSKYQSLRGIEKYYTINKISHTGENLLRKRVELPSTNISIQDQVSDSQGNIYLVGENSKWCNFNDDCRGSDLFLIKYNKNGDKCWERAHSSSASTQAKAALFLDGEIYVAGSILGQLENVPSFGEKDTLVCRFDSNGLPK